MSIKIENFELIEEREENKSQEEKKEYLKFLIEKGLEDIEKIANLFAQLRDVTEDSVFLSENLEEVIYSNLVYYKQVLPQIMLGNINDLSMFSNLSEEEFEGISKDLRKAYIKELDDKYGHLF